MLLSHSEMCTKISAPPSAGVINPCPLLRQNDLTVPATVGFFKARSVLKT